MPILGIGALTGATLGAGAGAKELTVAEDEINTVIKVLTDEVAALEENEFAVKGHISLTSFGTGVESTDIAQNHSKAHTVVKETLTELIVDLESFKTEIQNAKKLVNDADERSRDELAAILRRTQGLDLGQHAYDEARRGGNDPTDVPVTETVDDYVALTDEIMGDLL